MMGMNKVVGTCMCHSTPMLRYGQLGFQECVVVLERIENQHVWRRCVWWVGDLMVRIPVDPMKERVRLDLVGASGGPEPIRRLLAEQSRDEVKELRGRRG